MIRTQLIDKICNQARDCPFTHIYTGDPDKPLKFEHKALYIKRNQFVIITERDETIRLNLNRDEGYYAMTPTDKLLFRPITKPRWRVSSYMTSGDGIKDFLSSTDPDLIGDISHLVSACGTMTTVITWLDRGDF